MIVSTYYQSPFSKGYYLLLFQVLLFNNDIINNRGQDSPECKCRAYINVEEGQLDVLDFPSNTASSCTAGFECAGFCSGEVSTRYQYLLLEDPVGGWGLYTLDLDRNTIHTMKRSLPINVSPIQFVSSQTRQVNTSGKTGF